MPLRTLLDRDDIPDDAKTVIRDALVSVPDASATERALWLQRDLAHDLVGADSLDAALDLCLQAALSLIGFEAGGIYLAEEATGDLVLARHTGLSAEFVAAVSRLPNDSSRARRMRLGRSVYWSSAEGAALPGEAEQTEGLRSLVGVPVMRGDEVAAWLNVASRVSDEVPPGCLDPLESVAGLLGVALHRLQVGQALKASEERYRALVESAPDAIFAVGPDGRFISANQAAAAALGRKPDDLIGKHMGDVFPEPAAGFQLAHIARVLASGRPHVTLNAATVTALGERWYNTVLAPVRDQTGEVSCVLGIARDMTDQRQAAEALRDSEERYRALVESAPDAIFAVNAGGLILSVNPAAARLLGLRPEEAVGRSLRDVFPAQDAERRLGIMRHIHETGERVTVTYTEAIRGLGDRHFNAILSPVFDAEGRVRCVLGIARDITDQVEAENALRDSEARYRTLVEAATDLIFTHDREGRFLAANRATAEQMGLPAHELVGRRIHELLPSTEADRRVALIRRVHETGRPLTDTHGGVLPSNANCYLETWLTPVLDEAGEVAYVLGVTRDVTEQTEAEEERRRMATRLQQAEKLESLGLLAGGVAHDFSNLLTGVLGNLSLAARRLEAASPAHSYLARAERAASAAADLADQMLAYSGRGRTATRPLDLSELAADIGELSAARFPAGVHVTHALPADLPPVNGDATQLRQVALNLITNAAESIGDSEGVVTIETGVVEADRERLARTYIDDNLPAGRYVCLRVSDTGPGMDAETLARIFDPFFTTKATGRGFGLTSALGIVRGHAGAVQVESEVGRGTTFEVLLPAARKAAEPGESAVKANEPVGCCTGAVLVAEDEALVLAVATAALSEAGFTVLEAADGREALRVFQEHAAELRAVLLDLTMPKMDGLGVLREIRRLCPTIPVVVTSAYNGDDAVAQLGQDGAVVFVRKPYRPEQLVARLREVLGS